MSGTQADCTRPQNRCHISVQRIQEYKEMDWNITHIIYAHGKEMAHDCDTVCVWSHWNLAYISHTHPKRTLFSCTTKKQAVQRSELVSILFPRSCSVRSRKHEGNTRLRLSPTFNLSRIRTGRCCEVLLCGQWALPSPPSWILLGPLSESECAPHLKSSLRQDVSTQTSNI